MKSSKSIKGGTTFNRKTIYITLSSVASVTLGLLVELWSVHLIGRM